MGADGHWQLMRREAWDAKYPDLPPENVGLTECVVLGVHAVARYWETERDTRDNFDDVDVELAEELGLLDYWLGEVQKRGKDGVLVVDPGRFSWEQPKRWVESEIVARIDAIKQNPDLPAQQRIVEARLWFQAHAEDHEVWT